MASSGKGAVFFAVIGNSVLTVIKFFAFWVSGSGAMLSEAIHSAADSGNQALLYLGVQRSQKPADERYQYGYGGDRFFYALMSAVGIFVLGCGVTVYHGIHTLLHPPTLKFSWLTIVVLAIALLVDGAVFFAAAREVNRKKGERTFFQYVRTSTDPTLIAVLFEDFIASIGVIIALVGIGLSHITQSAVYDSLASIAIGLLLGLMAVWLGLRNRELLLGPAIPKHIQKDIYEYLSSQPSVREVRLVRTRIVGAERFRLAVEIDYNGEFFGERQLDLLNPEQLKTEAGRADVARQFGHRVVEALGDEVDRFEKELGERYPQLRNIDIEVD